MRVPDSTFIAGSSCMHRRLVEQVALTFTALIHSSHPQLAFTARIHSTPVRAREPEGRRPSPSA